VSTSDVVVVGAGVAGAAAAWLCAAGGARVSVIHDRAGSSALYSGVLDDALGGAKTEEKLTPDAQAFADALGLWRLGPTTIATREGVVRAASGADRALLDLARLAGKHVAVADVARDDWDAPLLVSSLEKSSWAVQSSTRFSLVAIGALLRGHERRITSHDFAALHDEPERLDALAKLLDESGRGYDGWLVGPWLGTVPATAVRLQSSVALPVGETASFVGGAAGARFESARDALFRARTIDSRRGRMTAIEVRDERWAVRFEALDGGRDDELEAEAVVLATGGVAAGGIELAWIPEHGVHGFRLPFEAPVLLSIDGEPGDSGGSLYGVSLETRGLGLLERVGVHVDATGTAFRGRVASAGLVVAGDALAERPRTVLEALRSGIRAGRAALLKARA
jgi:glycerol-3-phosphate dehydrogenase subunit B